jgi:hypothetical protein
MIKAICSESPVTAHILKETLKWRLKEDYDDSGVRIRKGFKKEV